MIEVRSCAGMEELDACVRLEIETWNYDETEIVARKTFLLAQKIGGQVMGAFSAKDRGTSGGELIGFALSLPAVKDIGGQPTPYLHSHMLAVKPAFRNRGVGTELKREQRREALARGIRRMEWTFDPLEIKNAFFNLRRLGTISRKYLVNFYGVSSSRLQGGLPTDRLVAEWELDSPRVQDFLDGRPVYGQGLEERIVVPAAVGRWKANEAERDRALEIQTGNRQRFKEAFARGLCVTGFVLDAEGNGIYELGHSPRATQ